MGAGNTDLDLPISTEIYYRPTLVPGAKALSRTGHLAYQIPLGDSPSDAHAILNILYQLAHQFGKTPQVREATVRILAANRVNNNDLHHQVTVISRFVKDRVVYVKDPNGAEYVVSPVRLLEQILATGRAYGDCDDHVLLLNSMLSSIGFDTRPEGVKLYRSDVYDHVITGVRVGGTWYDIDPCLKYGSQARYGDKLVPIS